MLSVVVVLVFCTAQSRESENTNLLFCINPFHIAKVKFRSCRHSLVFLIAPLLHVKFVISFIYTDEAITVELHFVYCRQLVGRTDSILILGDDDCSVSAVILWLLLVEFLFLCFRFWC